MYCLSLSNNNECLQRQQQQQQLYLYTTVPYIDLHGTKELDKYIERVQARGEHLGIFWVGMCRPELQIGTPF